MDRLTPEQHFALAHLVSSRTTEFEKDLARQALHQEAQQDEPSY